jgi:hypothetical protein
MSSDAEEKARETLAAIEPKLVAIDDNAFQSLTPRERPKSSPSSPKSQRI